MWIVETATKLYGPFLSPTAAARWAAKNMAVNSQWRLTMLVKP
jgi:hypothetical protein